jgi:hypothetical protein
MHCQQACQLRLGRWPYGRSFLFSFFLYALKRIFRKGIVNNLKIRIESYFFYYRKHPNTSLQLFVIDFTILDRFRTFRNFCCWENVILSPFLEIWSDIFQRSLKSLNYYYLIFLSRISTRFIIQITIMIDTQQQYK